MNNIENGWYRISAKALIYNEKWEILLCKENNWVWDIPWGWLDRWENPLECIKREIKEEMWLEIISIENTPKYFITAHKPESKTRPWIANICYVVKVKDLNFIPSNECTEIWFFSPNDIKNLKTIVNVLELSKQMLI
jgi:ADP-ribose pyrophosphatase YjhB (NUDIX family)